MTIGWVTVVEVASAAVAAVGDGDLGVGADLPAVAAGEIAERLLGHEEDRLGEGLRADLEAEGGRGQVVVADGRAAPPERALAVLAAEAEARLDDVREDEDGDGALGEGLCRRRLGEERVERDVDVGVDLGGRGGLGHAREGREGGDGESEGGAAGEHRAVSFPGTVAQAARRRQPRRPVGHGSFTGVTPRAVAPQRSPGYLPSDSRTAP